MSDLAAFHELTFLVEHVLFGDAADAEIHNRCAALAAQLHKSMIGEPGGELLARTLALVVGHRLNARNGVHGALEAARAFEAVAGALMPIAKRERAEEIARHERRKAS